MSLFAQKRSAVKRPPEPVLFVRRCRLRNSRWYNVLVCAILAGVVEPQATPAVQPAAAPSPPAGEQETIVIKGQTFKVYPLEQLRARGITVKDVPRDQNAAYVYIDAINAMVPMPQDEEFGKAWNDAQMGQWPQGPTGDRLSQWFEQNKTALDLARSAAQMPAYSMPLFGEANASLYATLLPQLADYRLIAKMLCAEATRKLGTGDGDGAVDDLASVQRMSVHFADGFTLIEGLVGIAVRELSNSRIREAAETGKFTPEQLARLNAEMQAVAERFATSEDLLVRERAVSESMVDDLMRQAGPLALFNPNAMFGATPAAAEESGFQRLTVALKKVYFPDRAVRRHLRGFYDNILEQSRATAGGGIPAINEEQALSQIPPWNVPARVMLPSLTRVYEISLRHQSNSLRTRIALAAQAYKLEHGQLPPTLSTLVPAQLPAVPIDPMTGAELEYALAPDGAGYTGLEPVNSKNEEQIRAKRKTPVIVNRRASEWRKYVDEFSATHALDAGQRNAAEGILRSMESQAVSFEAARGESIQRLRAAGNEAALAKELKPLDDLFTELKKRLDALPTAKQRAAAKEQRP